MNSSSCCSDKTKSLFAWFVAVVGTYYVQAHEVSRGVLAASIPVGIVAFQVQVRLVEEPHLLRTHGEPYRAWASRVGRFVPRVGRLAEGGRA